MSYTCNIKTNKEICIDDIENIVENLPNEFKGLSSIFPKQYWGWACICDVSIPNGKSIDISCTSSFYGKCNKFINYFERELINKGYLIVKTDDLF